MAEKKLVLIVEVRSAQLLKGRRTILPKAIYDAIMSLGLGLKLEDLYEIEAGRSGEIVEKVEEVAVDYTALQIKERLQAFKAYNRPLFN